MGKRRRCGLTTVAKWLRIAWLAICCLCLAAPAAAQDYAEVVKGHALEFPRDHGAHPAYRTEWWYATGWLKTASGRDLGFQVTFFRVRTRLGDDNPSRFAPRQILFAHAALADAATGKLLHGERSARAGFDLADAKQGTTDVRIDDWSLKRVGKAYRARIPAGDFTLDLTLAPTQPVLLQGEGGFSQKAADARHASYYYSQPQLAVSGSVERGGVHETVNGTAWLDHEWSSAYLPQRAVGWDWTGLNLDDGSALMAFRMRDDNGATLWTGGTLRRKDGSQRRLGVNDIGFTATRHWRSPRTGIDYPVGMTLRAGTLELELRALFDDQELDARASTATVYWEGAVRAMASGREVGRGYLELTGYGNKLRM